MKPSAAAPRTGPFDEFTWPEKLTARVVTPGPRPCLRGYDVEADLSVHYPWSATMLLSLLGELPDDPTARLFDVSLQFLGAISVAEAPSHAAVLARVCDASTAGTSGLAMLGLAEQARFVVGEFRPWLEWLREPREEIPEIARAGDDDGAAVERLRKAVAPIGIALPVLEREINRTAAVLATLFRCGFTEAAQIEVAMSIARFPLVMAEALATPAGSFKEYPVTLPQFHYEEES